MSEPCPSCGYIHASTDARAIGRFGTAPTRYVAATAGTPPRETRAEAEADECASRIRPKPQTSGADAGVAAGDAAEVLWDNSNHYGGIQWGRQDYVAWLRDRADSIEQAHP